jgi:hypothetical protein
LGNPVSGASTSINVSGSGNTISPAGSQVTGANGQAIWTVNSTVAEGKTVTATSGGVGINQAASFTVNPAAAKVLKFILEPGSTSAGATINPATGVQVEVRDTFANKVTLAANSVGIAILNNAGPGGLLSGTTPRTPSAGVVTFNDLSIDKTGTGYTLLVSATGLVPDTSAAFNITTGTATKLGFFTQPSNTTGGTAIPSFQVEIEDASGNRVSAAPSTSITLAFGNNPKNGHLGGTVTRTTASGVATFNDIVIDSAATGYTLVATGGGFTQATSGSFNVSVGAATKLGFVAQPSNTTGGIAIAPAVQVDIEDAGGNRVTSASTTITIGLGTNPKTGHLTGTTSVGTSSGLASFSNLVIDSAATGYTLTASGGFTGATSNTFNVGIGPANRLAFGQQPSASTGGATISPTVTVRILDAGGNLTASGASVSLAITNGTGTSGAHLTGGGTTAASGGVASFGSLSIDSAGTGYTLAATSSGLASATSSAFTVSVGAPARLVFGQQPTNTPATATMTPAVTVRILDLGGNFINTATNSIALAIGSDPSTGTATLSGGGSVAAIAGVATFSGLSIDISGNGYTLVASGTALASATSGNFNITP